MKNNAILTIITLFLCFTISLSVHADESDLQNQWNKMGFVILKSTTDYNEAKVFSEKAAQNLNYKLDLRGLTPNKKMGLTFNEKNCEPFDHPCYIARGRYDKKSPYISIEHSSAYKSFSPGYYIVLAASGKKPALEVTLKAAKKFYSDAYIKSDEVYMGCLH